MWAGAGPPDACAMLPPLPLPAAIHAKAVYQTHLKP